jgi:hypothetical protein
MYTLLNNETISQLEMEGVLIGTAVKLFIGCTGCSNKYNNMKIKEILYNQTFRDQGIVNGS